MKSHLLQSCAAPGPGPVPTPIASLSGVPPSAPPIAAAVIGPTGKMSPIALPGHTSGHSPILQALHQQQAGGLGRSPLGRSPLQPLQPAAYRSLFSSGGPDGNSPVLGTSPANPSRLRQSSGMMPPPPRPPASTAAFLAATAVPGAGHHLGGAPAAQHPGLEPPQRLERASSAGRSSGSARSSPRTSARGSPARGSPARSGPFGAPLACPGLLPALPCPALPCPALPWCKVQCACLPPTRGWLAPALLLRPLPPTPTAHHHPVLPPPPAGAHSGEYERGEEVEGARRSSRRQQERQERAQQKEAPQAMPSGLATLLMALDSTAAAEAAAYEDEDGEDANGVEGQEERKGQQEGEAGGDEEMAAQEGEEEKA
jgi:hypothetical protein